MGLDLLSILGNRENYNRFGRFVKKEVLSSEAAQIVNDLPKFYNDVECDDVEWTEFEDWYRYVAHPKWSKEKHDTYSSIFTAIDNHEESVLAEKIVESYVERDYGAQIADMALRIAEGDPIPLNKIAEAIEQANEELNRVSKLDSFFVTDDIDQLIESVEGGYEWRMHCLNRSIGHLRQGKLICFAARPNVGKTTFLASEATYVANQLEDDECILWFNNEEAGSDVKLRLIQAATGLTGDEIADNKIEAMRLYKAAIGNPAKIKILDKADIDVRDVEEIVKRYNPKMIVFDQLWKVHGFEKTSGTDTARLGAVYQWARELAKKYAPVVSVHQVKTEGEGVEFLTPSMLYLSGTVIQAEVDGLILMGRNYCTGQNNRRFIKIGKVKGAFGKDVDPSLREGEFEVEILPETAQFSEKVEVR